MAASDTTARSTPISAGRLGHPSGPKVGGGGLPPQLFEPRRVGGGVADGVLDVAVAEVVLDQPGVRAAGVRINDGEVPATFNRFYVQAGEQIVGDYPMPLDSDHIQVGG